jgi:hypothetical protein
MLSSQQEEQDRRETLLNDQKVRLGGTFLDFAQAAASDIGGRFAAHSKELVVGSTPGPIYPALPASSPWSGADPVGLEPPLGQDLNIVEPCGTPSEIEASIRALEPRDPLSSALGEPAPASVRDVQRGVGSPRNPLRRF